MKKILLIILFLTSTNLSAGTVRDANILNLYSQSHVESQAHAIGIDKPIENCQSNGGEYRLYIDFEDKEIYTHALASYTAGKTVDIIYSTDNTAKHIAGHVSATCKVTSMF